MALELARSRPYKTPVFYRTTPGPQPPCRYARWPAPAFGFGSVTAGHRPARRADHGLQAGGGDRGPVEPPCPEIPLFWNAHLPVNLTGVPPVFPSRQHPARREPSGVTLPYRVGFPPVLGV